MAFNFEQELSVGEVKEVDTGQIIVRVYSPEKLTRARVGRLIAIQGQDANEWLIGMVNRVWRSFSKLGDTDLQSDLDYGEDNSIQAVLVGTFYNRSGTKTNHFTRAIASSPDINREVFPIEADALEEFMASIGEAKEGTTPLIIGTYALDRHAVAHLNGDKLFQRHVALLGSTGSGKSYTVATILEQASELKTPNILLFDIHGEYTKLPYVQHIKIAGPGDLNSTQDNILYLPLWLLTFEEIQSLILDATEQGAPNQTMAVLDAVTHAKVQTLEQMGKDDALESFTVDSPIPFRVKQLVSALREKNEEVRDTGELYKTGDKAGQPKTIQGPLFDKLTRLLIRLQNKIDDRRYGFLFHAPDEYHEYESLHRIAVKLLGTPAMTDYQKSGIKVIDFSEVPADVLPVMVSLISRLVFQIQYWTKSGEDRHPVLLICDEAHLYLPNVSSGNLGILERKAVETFERIAKEGRKYGVGLFVVSQRPSDVNTTILSQCNNVIALRLTNERDKAVVKGLLPDSLGGILDSLAGLEVGEALAVGDATLLPSRIMLNRPKYPPKSSTIDFWTKWCEEEPTDSLLQAVENLRKQSKN